MSEERAKYPVGVLTPKPPPVPSSESNEGEKSLMSVRFYHHEGVYETANKAIVTTGPARSGTSLMGALIHSLEGVEYLYEPPMLYGLFPLIPYVPWANWCFLYETYLYYDCLLEALAGRRLNMNPNDQSYIGRAKEDRRVQYRLSRSWGFSDLVATATAHRIAYKMPDIIGYLPRLLEYYPHTKVVVMHRDAVGLTAELKKKGWFSDNGLMLPAANWPKKWEEGAAIPFWVPDDREGEWISGTETDRIRLYLRIMNSSPKHPLPKNNVMYVSYDSFVANPVMEFKAITSFANGAMTDKTTEILATVRPGGG